MSARAARMPFGKFKGHALSALPDPYLRWVCSLELREPLRSAIAVECERRFTAIARPSPSIRPELCDLAERIVAAGYRGLAQRLHPDAGGSNEEMRELNEAVDGLRALVQDARTGRA
jgi:hypothetical protein